MDGIVLIGYNWVEGNCWMICILKVGLVLVFLMMVFVLFLIVECDVCVYIVWIGKFNYVGFCLNVVIVVNLDWCK